jgi:hypothetical protein
MKKEIVTKKKKIVTVLYRIHSEETEINCTNHFGISLAL